MYSKCITIKAILFFFSDWAKMIVCDQQLKLFWTWNNPLKSKRIMWLTIPLSLWKCAFRHFHFIKIKTEPIHPLVFLPTFQRNSFQSGYPGSRSCSKPIGWCGVKGGKFSRLMASSEEFPLRQSSGKLQDNTNMLSPPCGKTVWRRQHYPQLRSHLIVNL